MSRPNDRPWTEEEKVYLLTEIIKSSQQPSAPLLLDLVDRLSIEPRWEDTPLPLGRSLRACQTALDEMRRTRRAHFPPQGSSQYFQQASPYYQQQSLQIQPVQPAMRKRPFQELETTPTSSGRQIQPRPSGAGSAGPLTIFPHTELSGSANQSPSEAGDEPARKKRGRPSKDEIQRREQEAASRGEVYAPKKRAPKKTAEGSTNAPGGSVATSPAESRASQKPEASRMSLHLSPGLPQTIPSERRSEHPTEHPSGDPMETSSPPRPFETALPPSLPPTQGQSSSSTESRSFVSYQSTHQPENTQFVHRSSSVADQPVPRFQPLLPSGNPPQPSPTSPDNTGSSMRSAYHALYDTPQQQTTSRQ